MPVPVKHQTSFRNFIVISLVIAMALSGIAWSQSEAQSGHACQSVSVVARISADNLSHTIQTNRTILPKITFPGLSHAELARLSRENVEREERHQRELEAVARHVC